MKNKTIKSLIWKILVEIMQSPLEAPNENENKQINELRELFNSLSLADENVSSEAEKAWNSNLNSLKHKIETSDPREFISWDVVRETMFVGNADYINVELAYLKKHSDWQTRWRSAIEESSQGRPPFFYRYFRSSGNLIHHAYHLARFEDQTGKRIDQLDCIFEFGGGYGSMCRLVHKLGFKGKYVIYDLPHFTFLQRYYLNSLNLPVKTIEQLDGNGIFCVSTLEAIEQLKVGGEGSLFLATWSLSETPISVREPILTSIGRCESILLAYQDEFGEVNNLEYFATKNEFADYNHIFNQSISHLSGSNYLFCWNI